VLLAVQAQAESLGTAGQVQTPPQVTTVTVSLGRGGQAQIPQPQVVTDKSTYNQGELLQFSGTGFTHQKAVFACLSVDHTSTTYTCVGPYTADDNGGVTGSMQVGDNIPPGLEYFACADNATSTLSNPVPLTITYIATFQESGIAVGVTWGVTVAGTHYSTASSAIDVGGFAQEVSYSYDLTVAGPPSSGTQFVCSTGCSGAVSGATTVSANYKTQYYLTTQANPFGAGTVSPSSGWHDANTLVTVSETQNGNEPFAGWSCVGSVGCTGSSPSVGVIMNGPGTAIANFGAPMNFDFRLSNSGSSSNPGGIAVARKKSGSITITVALVNGPSQTVSLSCSRANGSPLPTGVTCSFNPASGKPLFTSTLTITVTKSATAGYYTIKVTGTAGSLSRITLFTLQVT